jgi:hypothetical protein
MSDDAVEQLRFSRDRFGSRLLQITIDQLATSSLREFVHQIAGDPVIGQVIISRQAGDYNVGWMRRAACRAACNPAVYAAEREAVSAAAFVARLGDMAAALPDRPSRLTISTTPTTPAPEFQRRWRYLVEAALRRLQAIDAPNASLMRLALGCPLPDDGSAEDSARLQTAVSLAWTQLCARFPDYPLKRGSLTGISCAASAASAGGAGGIADSADPCP